MHKIKRVSVFFKWLFQVLFVLLLLTMTAWINAPKPLSFFNDMVHMSVIPENYSKPQTITTFHHQTHQFIPVTELNRIDKFYGFLLDVFPLALQMLILFFL